jgi:hypothetical protein
MVKRDVKIEVRIERKGNMNTGVGIGKKGESENLE